MRKKVIKIIYIISMSVISIGALFTVLNGLLLKQDWITFTVGIADLLSVPFLVFSSIRLYISVKNKDKGMKNSGNN